MPQFRTQWQRPQLIILLALFAVMLMSVESRADATSARALLEANGFEVVSSGIRHESEAELSKSYRKAIALRKAVAGANRKLSAGTNQYGKIQAADSYLMTQQKSLSKQASSCPSCQSGNKAAAIAARNIVSGQRAQLGNYQKSVEGKLETARQQLAQKQKEFEESVAETQKLAREVQAAYAQHGSNPELLAAVEQINQATGKSYRLAPNRSLMNSVSRLAPGTAGKSNDEAIRLRREQDQLLATIEVNGEHRQEFAIDLSASYVVLPAAVANELGVQPNSAGKRTGIVLTDGRIVEGQMATINEMTAGNSIAVNVEAIVLDADAALDKPVLGLSFLERFKFELDKEDATLELARN